MPVVPSNPHRALGFQVIDLGRIWVRHLLTQNSMRLPATGLVVLSLVHQESGVARVLAGRDCRFGHTLDEPPETSSKYGSFAIDASE